MYDFNSQLAHDIVAAWQKRWPEECQQLERHKRLRAAATQRAIETIDFWMKIRNEPKVKADFWYGFDTVWASATASPPRFVFPEDTR